MKSDLIHSLTDNFEAHAQQTDDGVEFWLARDLQFLLGYTEWLNFNTLISKAKVACEVSVHPVSDHFVEVNKMVDLGSGSQREVDDITLTRYACYLIAQNGDPRKPEIAFAQSYFALQTRRAEIIEQRLLEAERVKVRKKLTQTKNELSQVIYEQTGGNTNFGLIRSKGDHALFGKSTQAMKSQWKVPASRPLADLVLKGSGSLNRRGQIDKCVHQNHVFAVRPDTARISSEFFPYQSQSPYGKSYFLSVAHKTTNLACINTTKLKAFPVLLSPQDQQNDIVDVCHSIDGKIRVARLKKTQLQDLFRTLLHELMTAKIRVKNLGDL